MSLQKLLSGHSRLLVSLRYTYEVSHRPNSIGRPENTQKKEDIRLLTFINLAIATTSLMSLTGRGSKCTLPPRTVRRMIQEAKDYSLITVGEHLKLAEFPGSPSLQSNWDQLLFCYRRVTGMEPVSMYQMRQIPEQTPDVGLV